MSRFESDTREWLEADGLGGFASGTVSGLRTRRYHALLLVATRPPTGRVVLVNGLDAWVETPRGTHPISTQLYPDGAVWPHGHRHIRRFRTEPWPTWDFAVNEGVAIRQELFVPHAVTGVALRWSVRGTRSGVRLHVRPLLSGRDYHSLHHENASFRFGSVGVAPRDAPRAASTAAKVSCVAWQPHAQLPAVLAQCNGSYEGGPEWFRNFVYDEERQRALLERIRRLSVRRGRRRPSARSGR